MSNTFKKYKLHDLIITDIDCRGKTPPKVDKGIATLTAGNIKRGSIDLTKVSYVSEETYNDYVLKKGKPKEGDILITTEAPVGEVAMFPTDKRYLITRRVIALRPNDKIVDSDYLYFYLSSSLFQKELDSKVRGSTVPRVLKEDIFSIELEIPDLHIQKIIGRTLSSFNKKVYINNTCNETLEQMTQAIFKSWFVDFDPVKAKMNVLSSGDSIEDATKAAMAIISGKTEDELIRMKSDIPNEYNELKTTAELFPSAMQDSELGEIPEGWKTGALGLNIDIRRGGSPRPIKEYIATKGLHWLKIADATKEISPFIFDTNEYIRKEGLKKTVLLEKGSLVLSNSATPGLPKILDINSCIHDGWLHFPKISLFTREYLYFLFLVLRKIFISKGNGSVFTNLKTDILRKQIVVKPPIEMIDVFTTIVKNNFTIIKNNCLEIRTLNEIKETLLPKLLSGELDVSNIEV